MKKFLSVILSVILVFCVTFSVMFIPAFADSAASLTLSYDDRYEFTGASSVTSSDSSVITVSGNVIRAVGITNGTPVTVTADGKDYSVTVNKAKINIVTVAGQSNAAGESTGVDSTLLAKYSGTVPEKGTAYLWTGGASAPVDFTEGSTYNKGGFRGALAAEWYAQSSAAGSPEKTVVVYGTNYTATPGETIAEWTSDDSTKARHDKTAAMVNACYDYYKTGEGSNYYDISGCGMYWLQGESDRTQTAEYYYNAFSSLWSNLKQETSGRLEYCAFMRVRGASGSNSTLRYSGPVAAQYQLTNDFSDIFTASNLTEQWPADSTSDLSNTVDVDISNYHIFGGTQYADIVNGTVLTEQIAAIYGGLHYSRLGYSLIGADAAFNMYRSLRCPENRVTAADASGVSGTVFSAEGGNIAADGINGNLLIYAAPGSAATTVNVSVACTGDGARDITKAVLNGPSSSNTAFLINTDRLINYVDPLISVQTSFASVPVTVITGVSENPDPFGEDDTDSVYYHWDFTSAKYYKKGLTDGTVSNTEALKIITASDSTAYGVMEYNSSLNTDISYDAQSGISRSSVDTGSFLIYNKNGENGITASLTNGFVIEFTAKFSQTKTSDIVLGGASSSSNGIHPFLFRSLNAFRMGGSTPSVSFDFAGAGLDFTKEMTCRFECRDGALRAIVTQGYTKVERDGIISGSLTENFYNFKMFMPNFRSDYNFNGSVSDLKIWTSYYYGVTFDGSNPTTYTVSGLDNGCLTAAENRISVSGNGVYTVKSVALNGNELTAGEDGVYTVSNVTSDSTMTVVTQAVIGDHHVDDGIVTVEPTCENKGVKVYTCTDDGCDFFYEEDIPALGHSMDSGNIDFAPTANGMGLKVYRCTRTGCDYCEKEYISANNAVYYHWDFTDSSCYDTASGFKVNTAADSQARAFMEYTSSSTSELEQSDTLGLIRSEESTSAFAITDKNGNTGITLTLTDGFAMEVTAAFNADYYSILLGKTNVAGQGHPYFFKSAARKFTIGGIDPRVDITITDSSFNAKLPATYFFSYNGTNYHFTVKQDGKVYYDSDITFSSQVSEENFKWAYLFPNFRDGMNFSGSISDLKFWTSYCVRDTEISSVTEDFQNWYAQDGQFVSEIASFDSAEGFTVKGGSSAASLISRYFTLSGSKAGKKAVIVFDAKSEKGGNISVFNSGAQAVSDTIEKSGDYQRFISSPITLDRDDTLLSLKLSEAEAGAGISFKNIRVMYLDEGDATKLANTDGTPYEYEYGDVNCDGDINILDLVRMKKRLAAESDTVIYLAAANLTKKQTVSLDVDDLVLMVKKILELY